MEITPKLAEILKECGWERPPKQRGEFVITTRKGVPYTRAGIRAYWQRMMKRWIRGGNDVFTFNDIRAKWAREHPKPPNGAPASSAPPSGLDGEIKVRPKVFTVPKVSPVREAAAVMMPLRSEFDLVYEAIRNACKDAGFECARADDIWEESTIIQDIFNLIYKAHVVVVDFTTKNENVFYETGLAHALGRHVVPIAKNIDDVPFDIKHHRVLKYSDDDAGLAQLRQSLAARLKFIGE